jgi:hypothetical protein
MRNYQSKRNLFHLSVALAALTQSASAQLEVYNNQGNFGLSSIGFGSPVTMWDDLQLTQGGLLSEISFIARRPTGSGQTASGIIDLRVFDEALNRPQGAPLGTIPFSGTFELDPTDNFNRRLVIELTDLEPLGINLPITGRVGAGIHLNGSGWFYPDAGSPEVGTSPGGNWLDNSSFERSDAGGDMAWRVVIADPTPAGPGVGSYTLFQTALATPDHPTSNSFGGVSNAFFRGVGFRVERPTEISRVGAYMEGSGPVFAAIVRTDGIFSDVEPPDLSGDVIATTLINLPGTSNGANHTADIQATLDPGTYALVFGSGRFGADGEASVRFGHIPNGDWTPFGIRQSDGMQFFSVGGHRYVVEAKSAPGTLQVRPTFDVLAEVTFDASNNPASVRLIDGEPDITVDEPVNANDPRQYATFEFSLEDMPTDREIRSVTLELDLWFANSNTRFDVFGYAGDGTPGMQDAVGQQNVVGVTDISTTGITTIQIDPVFVRSLVGTASYLGLTIVPEQIGAFGFETLETGQLGEPPLLTINLGPAAMSLPGDFNGDDLVDAADYVVWRKRLGMMYTQEEYDVWRAHFGQIADSGSVAAMHAVVPEPASLVLMMLAVTAAYGGPRSRSKLRPGQAIR